MRYRVKLMGRSYCGEGSRGYLVAPQCSGRWGGNTARFNTWSVGAFGQWDLEVQEVNGQKPPRKDKSVVGLPLSIRNPGRQNKCGGGGFLAAGPSFQCRGPGGVFFDGSRANRWILEQVGPDKPHRFFIRLAGNGGCGAYLGAARKCGAPMEDPKLGLYQRDDSKAFTEFQLLPVAPCGWGGADCTHNGQCCEFQVGVVAAALRCILASPSMPQILPLASHTHLQGYRCYSGKCATRPGPPDGSPFAVAEAGPPVSLDVDVPDPKSDGGTAITRRDVTLESADGGDRISYSSHSDVRACFARPPAALLGTTACTDLLISSFPRCRMASPSASQPTPSRACAAENGRSGAPSPTRPAPPEPPTAAPTPPPPASRECYCWLLCLRSELWRTVCCLLLQRLNRPPRPFSLYTCPQAQPRARPVLLGVWQHQQHAPLPHHLPHGTCRQLGLP